MAPEHNLHPGFLYLWLDRYLKCILAALKSRDSFFTSLFFEVSEEAPHSLQNF